MKILKGVAIATATAALAAAAPASAAVTLQVENGILTGATGVVVAGFSSTFNVSFVDGSCSSLFGGCDSDSDFAFTTEAAATAAANALISQVFVDGPAGQFDSNPGLTRGCTSGTCSAFIPYDVNGSNAVISRSNNTGSSDTVVGVSSVSRTNSTVGSQSTTYAVFTSAVPEPATWAMMLIGFGAIGGAARYRRRNTSVAYA